MGTGRLADRTVTLCVTGSVAAYKAATVARLLLAEGADVHVVLTRSAERFVGPATFSGLTGNPVLTDMFHGDAAGEVHVELAAQSDVLAIVPATADVISRLAAGRASDLVTATVLCARCPVLIAPAMHPAMWHHPATARNVAALVAGDAVRLVGPVTGAVASGEVGMGRMAEPDVICEAICECIAEATSTADLASVRVVVTAGPTVEDLDPVRFLSNRSTGKMGFAVAARAAARGASVTLVAGPTALATPRGVRRVDVRSARDLERATSEILGPDLDGADAVVMAAAVGDYRPAAENAEKIKRGTAPLTLELVPNPDVLAGIGSRRSGARPVLVGFAVETASGDALARLGRAKLEAKKVDLVVANHAADSFGRDDNRALIVSATDAEDVGVTTKDTLADRILDRVAALLASTS